MIRNWWQPIKQAYFIEGRLAIKGYYVVAVTTKTVYKLVKFDRFFNQVYEKDYRKDMKALNFNSIQPLKDKLFVFADDHDKKENLYKVFGAEIKCGIRNRNLIVTL